MTVGSEPEGRWCRVWPGQLGRNPLDSCGSARAGLHRGEGAIAPMGEGPLAGASDSVRLRGPAEED